MKKNQLVLGVLVVFGLLTLGCGSEPKQFTLEILEEQLAVYNIEYVSDHMPCRNGCWAVMYGKIRFIDYKRWVDYLEQHPNKKFRSISTDYYEKEIGYCRRALAKLNNFKIPPCLDPEVSRSCKLKLEAFKKSYIYLIKSMEHMIKDAKNNSPEDRKKAIECYEKSRDLFESGKEMITRDNKRVCAWNRQYDY